MIERLQVERSLSAIPPLNDLKMTISVKLKFCKVGLKIWLQFFHAQEFSSIPKIWHFLLQLQKLF